MGLTIESILLLHITLKITRVAISDPTSCIINALSLFIGAVNNVSHHPRLIPTFSFSTFPLEIVVRVPAIPSIAFSYEKSLKPTYLGE